MKANSSDTIKCISRLIELGGVGIPVASAILSFLDYEKHRFGIVDIHTARFFNSTGLTEFRMRDNNWIKKLTQNVQE
jgi:endonuclease III